MPGEWERAVRLEVEQCQLIWGDGRMATNVLPHFLPFTTEASVVFLTLCDFLAVNIFPDIFTYGKFFLSINIYKHLDGLVKM